MSQADQSILELMVHKLQQWRPLDPDDHNALRALPYRLLQLRPNEYIVREGDLPRSSCLMLSGFSIRHKVAGNGGRQIFSIHMKGDLADLQNSLLGTADHNVSELGKRIHRRRDLVEPESRRSSRLVACFRGCECFPARSRTRSSASIQLDIAATLTRKYRRVRSVSERERVAGAGVRSAPAKDRPESAVARMVDGTKHSQ